MLFTFIVDYKGGTYISQVRATSAKETVIVWTKGLDTKPITGLESNSKSLLIEQLQQQLEVEEDAPVLLDGLKNVWCISAFIHNLMLINIIQTSEM